MSDINSAIQSVIDRVAAQAASAAPNDLVYLGKAIEAVSPSNPAAFIVQLGEAQKAAVGAAGTAQVAIVNAAGDNKISQVAASFSQQVALVNALGNVSGNVSVNLSQGSVITMTPNGNVVLTFTGFPPAGVTNYWEVEVIAAGSYTVTFNGVTWDNVTVPTLAGGTATSVIYFRTRNAGAKIYGGQSFFNIA